MAGEQRRTAEPADYRELPKNLPVEEALLGAVFIDNNVFRKVSQIVDASMFSQDLNRVIWDVMRHLIEKGQVVTPAIAATYLPKGDLVPGVTAATYCVQLAANATTIMNAEGYARTIRDLHYRRLLIGAFKDSLDVAYDAPVEETAESILNKALDLLTGMKPNASVTEDFEDFESVSNRAMDALVRDWRNDGAPMGLSTGYAKLDALTGGLGSPDFVVLAGRPGSGKTALATNIAFKIAQRLKERREAGEKTGVVGFYSLEMSSEQLWQRILADASGIAAFRIKRRKGLSQREVERLVDTDREIRRLPLLIDQTGKLSIGQLEMRARALKKRKGLELLVIDYLQLISGRGRGGRDENRVQEVTDVTNSLKALAKELGVPILALAQLSRKVDERVGHERRPRLSDLRESGSIEQDADMVIFIYREEYYLRNEEPKEGTDAHARWEADMRRARGVAEVIVAKQRHGSPGTALMGFRDDLTRFIEEPEERDLESEPERAERQKKAALPKDAVTLYGILGGLMASAGEPPTDELKATDLLLRRKKGARVIPVDKAREAFRKELLGDADAKVVEREFRARMKDLRNADKAYWVGNEEIGVYVWRPDVLE